MVCTTTSTLFKVDLLDQAGPPGGYRPSKNERVEGIDRPRSQRRWRGRPGGKAAREDVADENWDRIIDIDLGEVFALSPRRRTGNEAIGIRCDRHYHHRRRLAGTAHGRSRPIAPPSTRVSA